MEVLEGLKVLELGVWVAGPSVAALLADWGAEVVKLEAPEGDPFRGLFAALGYDAAIPNAPFALDNRGKRSLALDLRHPGSGPVRERLLEWADVLVTNLRPDALGRLGLDPELVRTRHPRLVVGLITGYGLGGPDADRPGYDVGAFWARSGLARQLLPSEEPPPMIRGGVGDHVTALGATAGIMAALYERERTGVGRLVETSLLRTGAFVMGWDLGIQLVLGKVAPTRARPDSPTPLLSPYRAGDGRWFFLIGLEADRHFPGLLQALDRTELADDPRFATARDRRRNSAAFIAELDAAFATLPLDDWTERFDREDVWWAPAQTPAEVVVDPQLRATGGFVEVEGSGGGPPFEAVASPVQFDRAPVPGPGPVPEIGEHSREVLLQLGFEPAEVDGLVEAGIVGGP